MISVYKGYWPGARGHPRARHEISPRDRSLKSLFVSWCDFLQLKKLLILPRISMRMCRIIMHYVLRRGIVFNQKQLLWLFRSSLSAVGLLLWMGQLRLPARIYFTLTLLEKMIHCLKVHPLPMSTFHLCLFVSSLEFSIRGRLSRGKYMNVLGILLRGIYSIVLLLLSAIVSASHSPVTIKGATKSSDSE